MIPQIQRRDLGSVVRTTFAATKHVPYAPNTPQMRLRSGLATRRRRIFGVFRARKTCLVAANVVLFLLNEIENLKQMWLLPYVTVHVVAY